MSAMNPAGPDLGASVRLLDSQQIHVDERLDVRRSRFATPDGEQERVLVHHPGAVAIVASPAPGQVLLVRQFRYPIQRTILEIPAGTRVPGEAPDATAHRELAEETGYRCQSVTERMRFYPSVGFCDEELIVFTATGLQAGTAAPESGELVQPEAVALSDLDRLVQDGVICDSKTLLALPLMREMAG